MRRADVVRAWGKILKGQAPSLSIEITKECPLRCPGCYAYEDNHLGGTANLRDLSDFRGDDLINNVLGLVRERRPLHLSIVGGDPLVRYREVEAMIPQIIALGTHVQLVTSAFRVLPASWVGMEKLNIVVSIDGLAPEHDVRRAPATYDRIIKNLKGHGVTVHCTITAQMMQRPGYLEEFVAFWTERPEANKIWFSIFTPQRGANNPEILTRAQREQVVAEITDLRARYPKLEAPEGLVRQFLKPPHSPEECIFALTTETFSADFKTKITPCQLGGDPDCAQCGCIASMALGAVGDHKLAGFISVGGIFRGSAAIGRAVAKLNPPADYEPLPATVQPRSVPAKKKAPEEQLVSIEGGTRDE
jgi:sulfatase maturation enzyme AslB (radical SAM superfamily)